MTHGPLLVRLLATRPQENGSTLLYSAGESKGGDGPTRAPSPFWLFVPDRFSGSVDVERCDGNGPRSVSGATEHQCLGAAEPGHVDDTVGVGAMRVEARTAEIAAASRAHGINGRERHGRDMSARPWRSLRRPYRHRRRDAHRPRAEETVRTASFLVRARFICHPPLPESRQRVVTPRFRPRRHG
jgi:hypothetical protein